jgi:hypothetical protein
MRTTPPTIRMSIAWVTFCVLLVCSFLVSPSRAVVEEPDNGTNTTSVSRNVAENSSRRPNSFQLQSAQAGSTTDIDNLRVVDLDTGNQIYSNSFSVTADATNNLELLYWPQGGESTANFVRNGSMTRVVGGKLRLETTGFNANGTGG